MGHTACAPDLGAGAAARQQIAVILRQGEDHIHRPALRNRHNRRSGGHHLPRLARRRGDHAIGRGAQPGIAQPVLGQRQRAPGAVGAGGGLGLGAERAVERSLCDMALLKERAGAVDIGPRAAVIHLCGGGLGGGDIAFQPRIGIVERGQHSARCHGIAHLHRARDHLARQAEAHRHLVPRADRAGIGDRARGGGEGDFGHTDGLGGAFSDGRGLPVAGSQHRPGGAQPAQRQDHEGRDGHGPPPRTLCHRDLLRLGWGLIPEK